MHRVAVLFMLGLALAARLTAQVPTGTITGTVSDQVAAVLAKATVTVTNKDTGASRVVQTGADGTFSVPSLPPGAYDVLIEAAGFQPTSSPADVVTGATTRVGVTLQLSTKTEAVTVDGSSPPVYLDANRAQGSGARA